MIAAIEAANRREPDPVPDGFKTREQWMKELGCGRNLACEKLKVATTKGVLNVINLRCADGHVRPFYGPA